MSGGGVHESPHDAGRSWATLIKGLDVFESGDASNPSFHDPHCVRLCPANPDRLYQQSHFGIYRLDRSPGPAGEPSADTWQRIGRKMPEAGGRHLVPRWSCTRAMPTRPGSFRWTCYCLATHQPRRAPGGLRHTQCRPHLAAAGPGPATKPGWWTVKRQAMTVDTQAKPALYLGTTSGELRDWA